MASRGRKPQRERRDRAAAPAERAVPALPIVAEPRPAAAQPAVARARRPLPKWLAAAIIVVVLIAAVFAVFGQTVRNGFINFDDGEYVTENREVRAGLTFHGIRTAFTRLHGVNWHPLTTLSHMLDCQLYGLWPGGHHLANVILHALAAALLFLVLRQMTGRTASSALVAFVFALHPLRVESVAWVAERKDVLSGVFFMLTIAAYIAYVRKPGSLLRTLLLPYVYAVGLMAKPMLVTTPLVLLLLDYWPLRRMARAVWGDEDAAMESDHAPAGATAFPRTPGSPYRRLPLRALVKEKLPLFILSAWSCAITAVAQASAMPTVADVAPWRRVENCLLAYAGYLKLAVWPAGLAIYYPQPAAAPSIWAVAGAAALLAGITQAAWMLRRRLPYAIVGWLWYIGMLVPVIGLVQVGNQALADRYTYLPLIGPTVAFVWFVADAAGRSVNRRFAFSLAGAVAVVLLAAGAFRQTTYWRNDYTLWQRTLDCTSNNAVAHLHLGCAMLDDHRYREAADEFEAALVVLPDFVEAHFDLGSALSSLGDSAAAEWHYRRVLELKPKHAKACVNLGMMLLNRGEMTAAADLFQQAIESNPTYALAYNNLGIVQMAAGRYADSAELYRKAIALDPDFPEPHANLGNALGHLGRSAEAVVELRRYLDRVPENATVEGWLAWVLATARDDAVRNGREALELAIKACTATHDSDARLLDTRAAAEAETGQFAAALNSATAARELALRSGDRELAAAIEVRAALYRARMPFRE